MVRGEVILSEKTDSSRLKVIIQKLETTENRSLLSFSVTDARSTLC